MRRSVPGLLAVDESLHHDRMARLDSGADRVPSVINVELMASSSARLPPIVGLLKRSHEVPGRQACGQLSRQPC